jgi:Chemotaxis response regulator containing a CheY-like receiver domain and a methylesterase domain
MRRNVVVIGASAGGVEALRTLIGTLPNDLPAAVLVVLHVPAYGGSVLPAILSRAGVLPAAHAVHGERLREGRIYVAPPDHHLALDDELIVLSRGPRENGHRPAIDVLFRTAARAYGPRVIGVVLSGVLDDGTAGLAAIAAQGGLAAVQEPTEALYPSMPMSAIKHVTVDHVDTAEALGHLLARLCKEELGEAEQPASPLLEVEADIAMMDGVAMSIDERPGRPSGFSCPDCNGVLWEIQDGADGDLIRFRCRVGHAWSAESLFGEQAQQLEGALWMALRGLEEKAALAREMGVRARDRNSPFTAQRFTEQAEDASRAASLIRSMLEAHVGSGAEPSET